MLKCYYCDEVIIRVHHPHVCRATGLTFINSAAQTVATNDPLPTHEELAKELDKPGAFQKLGEDLAKSEEYKAFVQRRLTESPAMKRARLGPNYGYKQPLTTAQAWQVTLSHRGKKGDVVTVSAQPKALFRADHGTAWDNGTEPGRGTKIRDVFVGNYPQRTLCYMFSYQFEEELRKKKMDTCQRELSIHFVVEFLEDCDWSCELYGKAVVT